MSLVHLSDLAAWPTDDASQAAHDRFRLLSIVAGQLGITGRRPTPAEWRIATVPVDLLPKLRDAVESEGTRTDRQRVPIAGRTHFRSIARHPARVRHQLLARVDRHIPGAGPS